LKQNDLFYIWTPKSGVRLLRGRVAFARPRG
jgi:hypothetical protein